MINNKLLQRVSLIAEIDISLEDELIHILLHKQLTLRINLDAIGNY